MKLSDLETSPVGTIVEGYNRNRKMYDVEHYTFMKIYNDDKCWKLLQVCEGGNWIDKTHYVSWHSIDIFTQFEDVVCHGVKYDS